ncbi:Chromosome partition protein Smc [Planctomycetes bacterium Pan216]|uniref:Chromosome partition protein Smc n=1 Tax=Kolteria novifilia TaxID=2527975 RepID=A0A518B533_9BACT|nr:Chromosome partition protein Smc [Planctomycetes bacterium Pan216]
MNAVGKGFAVANAVLSFVFLSFAFFVYQARVEFKEQLDSTKKNLSSARQQLSDLESEKQGVEKSLNDAKAQAELDLKRLQDQVGRLQEDLDSQITMTDNARRTGSKLNEGIQSATIEQQQRKQEVDALRSKRDELNERVTELVTQNTDLKDELAQTKNNLEIATNRNQQIASQLTQLETYVKRQTGQLPSAIELETQEGTPPPPDVEGIVTRVHDTGRFVEISLGEDDGLRQGQSLEIWRTTPEPKYLGKVKVFTTEATKSVVQPISVSGLIQPNDRVGPRIMIHAE